jgi:hypothetical protein
LIAGVTQVILKSRWYDFTFRKFRVIVRTWIPSELSGSGGSTYEAEAAQISWKVMAKERNCCEESGCHDFFEWYQSIQALVILYNKHVGR